MKGNEQGNKRYFATAMSTLALVMGFTVAPYFIGSKGYEKTGPTYEDLRRVLTPEAIEFIGEDEDMVKRGWSQLSPLEQRETIKEWEKLESGFSS